MHNVSLGIPSYGGVAAEWWTHMLQFTAALSKSVTVRDVITCTTMTADHSRNLIADEFLKSDAEWLFWIDSDTIVPVGAVERMLSHGRTLVSGLYYGKNGDVHPPIAYTKYNGAYAPISDSIKWERGDIINIDSAGMGCVLMHRTVLEDIKKDFDVFQIEGGGLAVVHKSDIIGKMDVSSHEHDGKVYRGQLKVRLMEPTVKGLRFPFFMIDHMRTEDMFFFELAEKVGHRLALDTSVECGHLRQLAFTGKDYREIHGK